MDLNYCLNFDSDWSFRRHNAEESRKSEWYVMEVVVVVVVDVCLFRNKIGQDGVVYACLYKTGEGILSRGER